MMADTDLQVWMDRQAKVEQLSVVPYVQSAREMRLNYRVILIQRGKSGMSRVSQQGAVVVEKNKPVSLSRLSISAHANDECRIEIALREGSVEIGNYSFGCAR